MAQLAIKGHKTRGKEVIEILGILGGSNVFGYFGNNPLAVYYIDEKDKNYISCSIAKRDCDCIIFTLEEFLEKFPYKIGDKVLINDIENDVYTIKSMVWDDEFNRVNYKKESADGIVDEHPWFADEMEFFKNKKETMEETETIIPTAEINLNHPVYEGRNEIDLIIPDGWKFEQRDNKMFGIRKQPQYPKTYEKCCDVLSISPYYNLRYHTYEYGHGEFTTINKLCSLQDKLNMLGKLIICRDAYWKIISEQWGWNNPWKPIYTDETIKYSITTHKNNLDFNGTIERNYVLIFPTKEIRNIFYENFKDLIEQCKELL